MLIVRVHKFYCNAADLLLVRASALWLATLTLLHSCWKQTQHIAWQQLIPMLEACALGSSQPDVHSLLISWVADAATQLKQPGSPSSAQPATQTSSAQIAAPSDAKIQSTFPPACFLFLTRYCRSSVVPTRHASFQAMLQVLQKGVQPTQQQLLALTTLACQFLSDTSQQVSQSCTQLLTALAAPAVHALLSGAKGHPPSWQRYVALQPQQLVFQPDQLAKLLEWLNQSSSLVVSQPGRLHTSSAGWLEALLKNCQSSNTGSKLPMYAVCCPSLPRP